MTTSTQAIGVVSAVQGKVFAHASNGKVRLLSVGDSVFDNEVIVTAAGAQIELTFFDRPALFVDELQKLALDSLMTTGGEGESSIGVAPLGASEAATVVETRAPAPETFSDTAVRDTTRAGVVEVVEAEAEGNSFVDLPRIGESLPPPVYDFPLNPPGVPPEIEGPLRDVAFVEEPPPPPDDGPDAVVINPFVASMILDESPLGADTAGAAAPVGRVSYTANLADNFASPIDYGVDGAGSVSYSLSLVDAGGNGIASGMHALTSGSILQGAAIMLTKDSAGDVVGSAGGTEYFRISVNNDPLSADFGKLTFSQSNNIWQQNTNGTADQVAVLALVGGDRLKLVQTVTDADGDQDSASVELGSGVFSIQDSGPTAAVPNIVVANESDGYALSPMFQPSTDPLLTADLTGNIPDWATGNRINDSTGLIWKSGGTGLLINYYVDPVQKGILYAYTDSDDVSIYGGGTDQKLIFTLSLDPVGGRIEVDMDGKVFSSNTVTDSSFTTIGSTQQTMLYVNQDGNVSSTLPAQLLFTVDSLQNGNDQEVRPSTSGLYAVGAAGDLLPSWTNGDEILVFDFNNAQLDFSFTPNFDILSTATIRWAVFSSVSGYSESGVMTATEGSQNKILTSIGSIDQVWLQADSTAFTIRSVETSRESDITSTFTASVIDNDNSQSSASFTVKFEGSREIAREDAEVLTLQTIGGLGGSSLNETLRGTASDEFLTGGSGNDVMVGGGGADTFVWRLSDVPAGTTTDKVLDFGISDRLDLRDLLSDASFNPSIAIDNAGAGARVTVSYTEGASLHSQDILITFDAGGERTLVNDSGIIKVG